MLARPCASAVNLESILHRYMGYPEFPPPSGPSVNALCDELKVCRGRVGISEITILNEIRAVRGTDMAQMLPSLVLPIVPEAQTSQMPKNHQQCSTRGSMHDTADA